MNNAPQSQILSGYDTLFRLHRHLDRLAPLAFLGLRGWVAWVFLKSGYLKISQWDGTLYLFENEFHTPFLSPLLAAYSATFIELVVAALLLLGFGGRISALILTAFNIIAVISYPDLGANGLRDHLVWGLMLLITLAHGPDKLSIDHWILRYLSQQRSKS